VQIRWRVEKREREREREREMRNVRAESSRITTHQKDGEEEIRGNLVVFFLFFIDFYYSWSIFSISSLFNL
jgi:hypothetical protein